MDQLVIQWVGQAGYLGIFLLMAAENVFPPIPSELIMGLAGIASAHGQMQLLPAIIVGTIGATLGNYFWYWVGAKYGEARLKRFVDRWGRWLTLDWREVEKLSAAFHKRGGAIIFTMRFVPGARTLISLPAGLFAMKRWKFFAYTFAGSGIWNAALAMAGYELGRRVKEIESIVGWLTVAVVAITLAIYLYRIVTWRPHDRRGVE